jgi:sulfur carrier protein
MQESTATIIVNGKEQTVPLPLSLHDLLTRLELLERRIAVELNGRIVRRPQYEETPVKSGDTLEILQMVGGG